MTYYGMAWYYVSLCGMVRYGTIYFGMVWGWCGVCYDVVRYGSWNGAVWYSIWRSIVGCGRLCCGMVQYML